jgi:hypothetical protein
VSARSAFLNRRTLSADDEPRPAEFEKGIRLQFANDVRDQWDRQRFQVPVADVAGGDQQELRGAAVEEVRVDEVCVFRDDDALFLVRNGQ